MADNELFGNSEQLDTISRAAVVDEIKGVDWYHINKHGEMVHGANSAEHQAWYKADDIYAAIERVPPAQSEPLTDKEQRIFLAAMGREEKVCKQVDEECRDCREPYEDSLVRVCHEIARKVKGALWT